MRRSERGEGGIKTLIVVVVVIYAIFCTIKIVGAKTSDASFKHKVETELKFAGVNRLRLDEVKYNLMKHAKEYEIPIKDEDVELTDEGTTWRFKVKYHRTINLVVTKQEKDINLDMSVPKG